ncbi:helix-turn-helix transcriptional regulator [Streptomyces sp. NPDC001523]|uniref:helix-turn-helix domain-containing protein n=1 Tax=Streptomyces sp. NPDC001523 TaxID=3154383 RepID=UPI003328B8C1
MGRRENAVAADTRQMEALALWLRAQRRRAALTYAAMAQHINYDFTASMLSRAAGGKTVPTLQVVEAFARACQVDPTEGRRLWKAARAAEHTRRRRAGEFEDLADKVVQVYSHPKVIETVGELRRAMVHLRARDGQPSLAELQRRAGQAQDGRHRLPKSSLGAVLRGDAVPTRGHVVAFAHALGMSRRKTAEWGNAWDRIVGEAGAEAPALPRQRTDRHLGAASDLPGVIGPTPTGRAHPRTQHQAFTDFINFYVVATTDKSDIVPVYHSNPPHPLNRLPRFMRGPLPPLPPAGRTGSGLPIRAPRRYTPLVTPARRGFLTN